MTEPLIHCPHCQKEIKLTESLAAPLVAATRLELEQKLVQKDIEVAQREAAMREQEQTLAAARKNVDEEIQAGIRRERESIAEEEMRKARLVVSDELAGKGRELAELEAVLKTKDEKLAEAQNAQAELLRKQRELDDARREMELTIEQSVQESLGGVRDKAKREAEDALKLKLFEREETIAGMQRQIDALKQKAEQGSQQLQGEVQEPELETLLAEKFTTDTIRPVPKGEFGGDIVQTILTPSGIECGRILWESKRTRNWSDGWLEKMRGDQRAAQADFAIIVSRALPKGVDSFDLIGQVWVVDRRCVLPLAIALRQSLIQLAAVRQAKGGQSTKMGMVYQYLTGPRFRAHVESVVERFSEMQDDLNKERRTIMRLWAKRDEQIQGVLESTATMYGDLQGIAGKSLEEIRGLQMELLPAGE